MICERCRGLLDAPRIPVRTYRGAELVDMDRVRLVRSESKYTILYRDDGREFIIDWMSVTAMVRNYPGHLLQIRRGVAVGLRFIEAIDSAVGVRIKLRGLADRVVGSRRFARAVRDALAGAHHLPGSRRPGLHRLPRTGGRMTEARA